MREVKKKPNSKTNFILKNLHWLTWSALLIPSIYFSTENFTRSIAVSALLLVWAFIARKENPLKASILTFLFALPFNITIAFPSLVDPYVAGVYVNYLVPVISILDLFILLTLSSYISSTKDVKSFFREIPKPFYLLLGYFALHVLLHPGVNVAINSLRLVVYVLGIHFAVKTVRKEKFFKDILLIFAVSVAIQLAIGLLQFSNGRSLGLEFIGESKLLAGAIGTSFIRLSNGEFLRAYGTFPHPNVLAGYSLFVFFVASVSHYLSKEKKLTILLIILSSFLLIFTFSRITILLWVMLLFTIGYLSLKGKGMFILIFERFGTFFNGNDYSLGDRIKLARESLRIIGENKITGIGSGNFTRALEGSIPYAASGISLLQPVHNIFLLLAAEHGILAAIGLVVPVIVMKLRQIFSAQGLKRTFLLLGFLFVLVVSAFDHYPLTLPQGLSILLISLFL